MPRLFIGKRTWTPEEDALLRQLTSDGKLSYRQMVPYFNNRTTASLMCRASQHLSLHNPYAYHKWDYNKDFFETPNPLNSYVAGFLAADGSVIVLPNNHGFVMRLEVANMDKHHLERIKNAIGYTGPIWPGGGGRNSSFFKMTISKKFKDDLERNFGVIPDKARRFSPPDHISKENQFAYMIGLLDGDGCVHINRKRRLAIRLVSCCQSVISWFKQFVDSFDLTTLHLNTIPTVSYLESVHAYSIAYTGNRAICLLQMVRVFVQKHNLPVLERKWLKDDLTNMISEHYVRNPEVVFNPEESLKKLYLSS